jgi:hypothetical protein
MTKYPLNQGQRQSRWGHAGQVVTPDPSREPALERAMPADAVPGSTIPEDTEAEVLLRTGHGCGHRSSGSAGTGTAAGASG